ncbi:MAG: MgtC/SapB family protein, partial [Gemmatimonadales bacterium]|nr:MgtC/SapB family protein [Gemmatimonadales bacterium]
MILDQGLHLAVAGLVGLAVGIEREWSGHAVGPHARFAGVRTFLLLGLLGGVAGTIMAAGHTAAGVALLAGGLGLTMVAYFMAARRPDDVEAIEATTEVAALVV